MKAFIFLLPLWSSFSNADSHTGPLPYPIDERMEIGSDLNVVPNSETEVDFIAFLKHKDPEVLYGALRAVSDPKSPYYGQWFNQEDVRGLVGCSLDEMDRIGSFFDQKFEGHKMHFSLTGDHLFMRIKLADLMELFHNRWGYVGTYNTVHKGSGVLLTHTSLSGDDAQEDFLSLLPDDIADMIDSIQAYLPEHMYVADQVHQSYGLYHSNVCSAFEYFVTDDEFPTGLWSPSVKPYDEANHIDIITDPSMDIHVLPGTRGVKDRGIFHFVPSQKDGSIRLFPKGHQTVDGTPLTELSSEELWSEFVDEELFQVKALEIMVTQDDVPRYMTYPFNPKFVEATVHRNCTVDRIEGECIAYQIMFNLSPYRPTKVLSRLVKTDGTETEWDGSKKFFTNSVVEMSMIRDRYQMRDFRTHKENTRRPAIIVTSYLEEQFDPQDTKKFVEDMGYDTEGLYDRIHVIGPNNPNEGRMTGIEASLDVEIIAALAPEYDILYWNVPGRELTKDSEPFLRLMYQLSTWNEASAPLPEILSISYGDEELHGIGRHLKRLDQEFAKLGLMGMTVISASGDDGANGMKARNMKDPDRCSYASPGFPASLPSVTSVGATALSNMASRMCYSGKVTLPPMGAISCDVVGEIVSQTDLGGSMITSGGGFSYYFNQQDNQNWYQNDAVAKYIRTVGSYDFTTEPPTGFFNTTGRGFPDISVLGTNVPIVLNQRWAFLSGTSVSAPVASGLIANLRNALGEEIGLNRMGFLNPMIYAVAEAYPDAFNDITVGRNNCGYKDSNCCDNGFDAVSGWDPASGLGSIKVDRFITRFKQVLDEMQSEHRPL